MLSPTRSPKSAVSGGCMKIVARRGYSHEVEVSENLGCAYVGTVKPLAAVQCNLRAPDGLASEAPEPHSRRATVYSYRVLASHHRRLGVAEVPKCCASTDSTFPPVFFFFLLLLLIRNPRLKLGSLQVYSATPASGRPRFRCGH